MSESLNLFVISKKTKMLNLNHMMQDVYNTCQDKDGFLYIVYASENPFGS